MNNEQTKTPGQIAFEAFMGPRLQIDGPWNECVNQHQFNAAASAVISHVLQGAKYVLVDEGAWRHGDEVFDAEPDSGWTPIDQQSIGSKIYTVTRRLISIPSSVRPKGKPGGPSTPSPAGSGAAGADVLQMFQDESEREMKRQKALREGKSLSEQVLKPLQPFPYGMGDNVTPPNCRICAKLMRIVPMVRSKAIPEAVVNLGEGQHSIGTHVGNAPLVDVWKCPECGHSFRCDAQPVWQLPPPPAGMKWHREDWTQEMLPEGWRPLLRGEYATIDEDEFASYPNGVWLTVQATGPSVPGQLHTRTRRTLPQSAEPVVEKDPNAMTPTNLLTTRSEAECLKSECGQLRKELEETREHLQGNLTASRNECQRLTTENAALKRQLDEVGKASDHAIAANRDLTNQILTLRDEVIELKERVKDESEQCVTYHNEITALRSQLTWTPVSERMPTEKDAVEVPGGSRGTVMAVRWCFQSQGEQRVGVGLWNLPINNSTHWQRLSPLPTVYPPETEEEKSRREFEAWWQRPAFQKGIGSGAREDCWSAWQAAKQSTVGPA